MDHTTEVELDRVLDKNGEEFKYTPLEWGAIRGLQRVCNDQGYKIDITSLSDFFKKITEERFVKVNLYDFVPIASGQGFIDEVVTWKEFSQGSDFESGFLNTGKDSRLTTSDAEFEKQTDKVIRWARAITFTLFDLQLAANSGQWSILDAKSRSRKRNFDLGLQELLFLGSEKDPEVKGLLNQSGITVNTSLLGSDKLTAKTAGEFNTFLGNVLDIYESGTEYSATANRFALPSDEFNGLSGMEFSATYPVGKNRLTALENTLKKANPECKVVKTPYAIASRSRGVLTKDRIAMYNHDDTSIRLHTPIEFNTTMQNSVNNFQFTNVGFASFTGVGVYRPKELLYIETT